MTGHFKAENAVPKLPIRRNPTTKLPSQRNCPPLNPTETEISCLNFEKTYNFITKFDCYEMLVRQRQIAVSTKIKPETTKRMK